MAPAPVLVATVAAVGVLHTLVPDHWAPIVVIGRQKGWSLGRTARSAAIAGLGHVASTLLLGVVLWLVGTGLAMRYAHAVDAIAALALIGFGGWIAYGGWRELREARDAPAIGHAHLHRHDDATQHVHWHEHPRDDPHGEDAAAAAHAHEHAVTGRAALLLIVGSSPMLEGIPAFLAASGYGAPLVAAMAIVFGSATVATYVVTTVVALARVQSFAFGPVERYGEVLSGGFVAAVGLYALLTA